MFETLGGDDASIIKNSSMTTSLIKASVIEENGCEAYTIEEVVVNDKVKEVGVNNTRVDKNHGETFSTFVPETWVVAPESQRKTQEMEGGSKEAKIKVDPCDEDVYHESGQRGKHAMWSLRNLVVSMRLNNGLLSVVNINFWIRP